MCPFFLTPQNLQVEWKEETGFQDIVAEKDLSVILQLECLSFNTVYSFFSSNRIFHSANSFFQIWKLLPQPLGGVSRRMDVAVVELILFITFNGACWFWLHEKGCCQVNTNYGPESAEHEYHHHCHSYPEYWKVKVLCNTSADAKENTVSWAVYTALPSVIIFHFFFWSFPWLSIRIVSRDSIRCSIVLSPW